MRQCASGPFIPRAHHDRHHHPPSHLPPVRGLLRTRNQGAGRQGHQHPRARSRRVQRGLHLPQGRGPERPARRPGPPAHPADQARRRLCAGQLGRSLCRDPAPRAAADGRPRAQCHRHRRGQPVGPQDRPAHLFRQAGARAGHEERVFRLHAGPDAQAARQRADVRPLAVDRTARHRPHRLPAGAGRQSPGEQRQHVDRARLQG